MNDHAQSGKESRRYFTQIPNIVFHLGLSVYAFALYAAIKRAAGEKGKCIKNTDTLHTDAGMSTGMVSKAKQQLVLPRPEQGGRALITIKKVPVRGKKARDHITATDIWDVNERTRGGNDRKALCSDPSNSGSPSLEPDQDRNCSALHRNCKLACATRGDPNSVHQMNDPVHPMNGSCSPDEIENNQPEENPREEKHREVHIPVESVRSHFSSSRRCSLEEAHAYAHEHQLPLSPEMVEKWWLGMEAYGWQLPNKEGQMDPVRNWPAALRGSVIWLPDAVTGRYLSPRKREARKAKGTRACSPMEKWAETIVRTYPGKGYCAGPR